MKVYIAGPISPSFNSKYPLLESLKNIKIGIKASVDVLLAGHQPFCPFLDFLYWFFLDEHQDISATRIKQYSMEWLKSCDAMIVLHGWEGSNGTLAEMKKANELGITIYHGIDAFLDFSNKEYGPVDETNVDVGIYSGKV